MEKERDPVVAQALKLINENYYRKTARDARNRAIRDMLEAGFSIREPLGAKKVTSKKFFQAYWRWITKIKMHDFEFHGDQAPYWLEKVMSGGMGMILDRGGWNTTFVGKMGTAQSMITYGDGFRMIGARGDKGFPVEFMPIANSNLYVNTKATSFRNSNRQVTRAAAVFSGTKDEFDRLFPDNTDIAVGPIPREYMRDTDLSDLQRQFSQEENMEWCYYYDKELKQYVLFAGPEAELIDKKVDEDYKWVFKDANGREEPYIPISHYVCFPSWQDFYNHGLMDYLYDLALFSQGIFNALGGHVQNNALDINVVNIPHGTTAAFYQKMKMAYQENALGRRGLIPIEYAPGSANSATIQGMSVPALVNEAEAIFKAIENEFARVGVYLDEIDKPEETATKTLSQIEKQNESLRQLQEGNAAEAQFELEAAVDLVLKGVSKNDKTPLDLTTIVNYNGQYVRPSFLNLGLFKTELKERHWFFRINSRSGVIPSNTLRRIEIEQMLSILPPGSPQQTEAIKQYADINNFDFDTGQMGQMQQMNTPPDPNAEGAPSGGMNRPSGGTGNAGKASLTSSPSSIANDEVQFRSLSK